jgi:hypothetical protein
MGQKLITNIRLGLKVFPSLITLTNIWRFEAEEVNIHHFLLRIKFLKLKKKKLKERCYTKKRFQGFYVVLMTSNLSHLHKEF